MIRIQDMRVCDVIAHYLNRDGERIVITVGRSGSSLPLDCTMSFAKARQMLKEPELTREEQQVMTARVSHHYCTAQGSRVRTLVILAEVA